MSHGKRKTYRKRLGRKDIEKQVVYTEKVLQPEIISANPKTEEIIEESMIEPEGNVSVPLPKRDEKLRKFLKWAKSK